MTSGESPTGPSRAKLGGIALIGIGLLAGGFGVATTLTDGAENTAGSQPPRETVSSPPQPSSESPRPSGSQQQRPDEPQQGPDQADSMQPPPESSTGKQPTPGSSQHDETKVMVRVYNNSTIEGLAHRAADDFRAAGYEVPEIGNYSAGLIYTTTVYFRPGTEEEAQAREIAQRFGARLEPRFAGIEQASPGVIAIITNDYTGLKVGK